MSGFGRREFLGTMAASTLGPAALAGLSSRPGAGPGVRSVPAAAARPAFIATWGFGMPVCDEALQVVRQGGGMLDAIESGIRVCEADESNTTVGVGGTPNADGVVQLDALIMSGPGHQAGSVAGLEQIAHPISVARQVMEHTDHVLLVGEGARQFALQHGHQPVDLLNERTRKAWESWKAEQDQSPSIDENQHDTITLLGVDPRGNLYGGCSTSGLGFKLPGRVGDSPIVGGGLYVDNTAGAAGATGKGENVMRHCGSFLTVEFMRNGRSPQQACEKTIERIADLDPRGFDELDINFIALNREGEFGAAGTSDGFQYAVANPDSRGVHDARILN